ncbi:baseplate J/gp47 family protein [Clostridium sp. VAP41]|uniref:baseplate J/gp47 family protein n=1 Tax=Clostridium sp. VAP41 TaxID=2949979 RepID=UPI0020798268|nr:baseplate J/gp47 family protein [Clostridium sp. VAP41]
MFFKSAEDYYKEMTSTLKDVDISKKSLVYNSLMPCCYELSYQSMMLDEATKMVFANSALENKYSEYLERRCLEQGIKRKEATIAIGTIKVVGKKKAKLPQNALISTSLGLTYITQQEVILDDSGIGYTTIIAEKEGSKYNADIGEINSMPVKYEGIFSIINEEKINNGYDQETDEDLYNRYLLKVQTPATSGNKYHYEQWAREIIGVGFAKCIPGKGNVKVIITDSNKKAANKELIKETYDHIDNIRPLLAGTLEVITVKEITINITANVEIDTSVILGDIEKIFKSELENYFNEKVYNTKKISIAKLNGILIDIDGVVDIANLKINNSASNITLSESEIAVLGTVTLGVM